jgi:hypothetical protein
MHCTTPLRRLAAVFIASGLLLSACGQSDSGRVRNSSIGESCFATQADKDEQVNFLKDFVDLANQTQTTYEQAKKDLDDHMIAMTDITNRLYAAIAEAGKVGTQDSVDRAKLAETEWDLGSTKQGDLSQKLADANRSRRDYSYQAELYVTAKNKPVCETSVAQNTTQTTDTTPTTFATTSSQAPVEQDTSQLPDVINNDIVNNSDENATKANVSECKQAPDLNGKSNEVLRVGETLEFTFPRCSSTSYITLSGDFSEGLTVYSNEVTIEDKPHVIFLLSSSAPLSGTYFFQQIDSATSSLKSQLDLTFIAAESEALCAGKVPDVQMDAHGVLTAKKTCAEADRIRILIKNITNDRLVVDTVVDHQENEIRIPGSLSDIFGTDEHEVEAVHVKVSEDKYGTVFGRMGDVLNFQFQLKDKKATSDGSFDNNRTIDVPPLFDSEPRSDALPTSDSSDAASEETPQARSAKILLSPETTGMSCSESCVESVAKQANIKPANVETIEASVNGAAWVTLTPEVLIPLVATDNSVAIRVTPKGGGKPVVLTTALYRDTDAMSGVNEAELITVSAAGEQTITFAETSSGISPILIVLIALLVLALLAIALVVARKKRSVVV